MYRSRLDQVFFRGCDDADPSHWVLYIVELIIGECPGKPSRSDHHAAGLGSPLPERGDDVCVCLVISGHQSQANNNA